VAIYHSSVKNQWFEAADAVGIQVLVLCQSGKVGQDGRGPAPLAVTAPTCLNVTTACQLDCGSLMQGVVQLCVLGA
jgi:hypothetical protein